MEKKMKNEDKKRKILRNILQKFEEYSANNEKKPKKIKEEQKIVEKVKKWRKIVGNRQKTKEKKNKVSENFGKQADIKIETKRRKVLKNLRKKKWQKIPGKTGKKMAKNCKRYEKQAKYFFRKKTKKIIHEMAEKLGKNCKISKNRPKFFRKN